VTPPDDSLAAKIGGGPDLHPRGPQD